MKYVIMFTSTPELDAAVPPERLQEIYGRIFEWYQEHDAAIEDSGAELMPADTATSVKSSPNGPVVVDGPFSEAKEVIGGFSVIDVPDLDAALALAQSWPMLELEGTSVEVRPMVTDYSQFEQ
ncbi:YciI family protein [Microbacterium sp. CFBP9034]|uniref:YciI family protein n=1 Tax=Microbacterium sp. CFBP9034 TaxID=3096540 RepID=UPI002A6A791E|nr:YciI family protein [Microbacterium sp. CFBP9034]MDY0909156.1 YciI family protein [Microbacterium sp. CFBP9034]